MASRTKKRSKPDQAHSPIRSLFPELESNLEAQPGKPIRLRLDSDDIGGELISILSKGLYTNPLDCLREYAQNGVDAQAKTITIKITGNSLLVFDDGVGMNLSDFMEAKKFGLSPKSITQHVGFRGIGIYSGFDLCRRLIITSKRKGDQTVHVMSFEFAEMKARLDRERQQGAGGKRTSLVNLLSAHTTISRRVDERRCQRSLHPRRVAGHFS